jgi:hypothetical protein
VVNADKTDVANGSNKTSADTGRAPRDSRKPGFLMMWPVIIIVLVALAGALFGARAALLVAGEVVAILAFVVLRNLWGDRLWEITGIAVIVASVTVLAGLQQLQPGNLLSNADAGARAAKAAPSTNVPAELHGQAINAQQVDRVRFQGSNLINSRLNGLDLRGKDFDGANAAGASFRGSRLDGASLRGVDLRGACLRGASLQGADLSGADLTDANVQGVSITPETKRSASAWPPPGKPATKACR